MGVRGLVTELRLIKYFEVFNFFQVCSNSSTMTLGLANVFYW